MTWTGLHCRVSWTTADVDTFLTTNLGPLLAADVAAGHIGGWYFLRYWETGPHLRVRVRGASATYVTDLAERVAKLIANADHRLLDHDHEEYYASIGAPDVSWLPHGDVREVPYEPEIARYGGLDALPVSEELFCRSTEVALAVLPATRTTSAKLSAAFGLAMATATALGFDRPGAAAWLRSLAASWRNVSEPAQPPSTGSHRAASLILSRHAETLDRKWAAEPTGATAHWASHLRAAYTAVGPDRDYVWASQLHMLFNRLGLTPEEERLVCWVVAASAATPGALTPFHDDGADAPDRRYQQASKFLPGFDEQLPHTLPEPRPSWQPRVSLPAPEHVPASLTSALRDRASAHSWSGTLSARELASLLWTAQGSSRTSGYGPHRPYPSAGAAYCARLRIAALDVDGLEPGSYDVDEVSRELIRTGPAPSVPDLEDTSVWFGPGAESLERTPAMLGLYVRNGFLRQKYGLRALRFAFTEAGHLAQNLSLVAAATGLALGMIGGFYDDVAHDVFGLDGVDETLVYLLPLARLRQLRMG